MKILFTLYDLGYLVSIPHPSLTKMGAISSAVLTCIGDQRNYSNQQSATKTSQIFVYIRKKL